LKFIFVNISICGFSNPRNSGVLYNLSSLTGQVITSY